MARARIITGLVGLAIVAAAALTGSAGADSFTAGFNPNGGIAPLSRWYADSLREVIVGSTEAGKKLQWVDAAEATLPDKPELPQIEAGTWLPAK